VEEKKKRETEEREREREGFLAWVFLSVKPLMQSQGPSFRTPSNSNFFPMVPPPNAMKYLGN
jgi:hypothetical protein